MSDNLAEGTRAVYYVDGKLPMNTQTNRHSSSSMDTCRVRFTIIDPDCGQLEAIVQIDDRYCGCCKVPDESDGQLTVIDTEGFFLNEPNEKLLHRMGYAKFVNDHWEISVLTFPEDAQ